MGFFSFNTQDTDKSIQSRHSCRETFPVHMTNGDEVYTEPLYEGYGVFGGKDYFELTAEMNGLSTREEGIDLYFSKDRDKYKFPNIVEDLEGWEYTEKAPDSCEYQGYFYDEMMGDIFG